MLNDKFSLLMKVVFEKYRITIMTAESGHKTWEILLILTGALSKLEEFLKHELIESFRFFEDLLNNSASVEELFKEISKYFLRFVFSSLQLNVEDIDVSAVLTRISIENFSKLITVQVKMSNDEYRFIFDEMLKCDLMGRSVTEWMRDCAQNQPLGLHNQKIRQELTDLGVHTDLAFNYSKAQVFHYEGQAGFASVKLASNALWGYVQELLKVTKNFIASVNVDDAKHNVLLKQLRKLQTWLD